MNIYMESSVNMPNIDGKYRLTVKSNYGGGTTVEGEMLVKTQSVDKRMNICILSVDCKFENSYSVGSIAHMYFDFRSQTWKACCEYTNIQPESKMKEKWEPHFGVMLMHDISEKKIGKCYYMNIGRDTKGEIICEYITGEQLPIAKDLNKD